MRNQRRYGRQPRARPPCELPSLARVTILEISALAQLSDNAKLVELGLDSRGFAWVVAHLEDTIGFDPLPALEPYPVTFGEFVKPYESFPR